VLAGVFHRLFLLYNKILAFKGPQYEGFKAKNVAMQFVAMQPHHTYLAMQQYHAYVAMQPHYTY
jgi:hypothetical protein